MPAFAGMTEKDRVIFQMRPACSKRRDSNNGRQGCGFYRAALTPISAPEEQPMKGKRNAGSQRARNPFAILVRRRKAGPAADPRSYRRRPKHGGRRRNIEAAENGEKDSS
jgi:hypothetical protein